MTWYADLSPCNYFGEEFAACLHAVGWLERGQSFATGPVDRAVYDRLVELLKEPWEPGIFMGFHSCDLCLYEGNTGQRNLFIPSDIGVFVCPELITHYMNAHGYQPPEEFCQAVLACPKMRSMPYLKALMAGARPFMQAVTRRESKG